MKKILVTGSSGFIGFHLSKALLEEGFMVIGYDSLSKYYDVELKKSRQEILNQYENFKGYEKDITDFETLNRVFISETPDVIVHLAAQAGVRYSIEQPRTYIESNIVGTFNIMECAREYNISHLLIASTSSIYGGNKSMPYRELDKADLPLTIYAASKKATEAMTHAYSNLWQIPTTVFRFFTVYGPWGRPDMAFFKFTKNIIEEKKIDIFNNGDMERDFTYVEDIAKAIRLLIDVIPQKAEERQERTFNNDSLSPVAPHRIVNIGNSDPLPLLSLIEAIERATNTKAIRNFMEMQKGDVKKTHADVSLLQNLTGYTPDTELQVGVNKFVEWYRKHYA